MATSRRRPTRPRTSARCWSFEADTRPRRVDRRARHASRVRVRLRRSLLRDPAGATGHCTRRSPTAVTDLTSLVEEARSIGDVGLAVEAWIHLADAITRSGEPDRALSELAEAKRLLDDDSSPLGAPIARIAANALIEQGDLARPASSSRAPWRSRESNGSSTRRLKPCSRSSDLPGWRVETPRRTPRCMRHKASCSASMRVLRGRRRSRASARPLRASAVHGGIDPRVEHSLARPRTCRVGALQQAGRLCSRGQIEAVSHRRERTSSDSVHLGPSCIELQVHFFDVAVAARGISRRTRERIGFWGSLLSIPVNRMCSTTSYVVPSSVGQPSWATSSFVARRIREHDDVVALALNHSGKRAAPCTPHLQPPTEQRVRAPEGPVAPWLDCQRPVITEGRV